MELLNVWGIFDLRTISYVKLCQKYGGANGFLWNELQSLSKVSKLRL